MINARPSGTGGGVNPKDLVASMLIDTLTE
jgi:hypothetical protein